MKVKLYIVLMVLMAIPVAKAQTTDTISKNTNRPAVLDLLGRNNGSNKAGWLHRRPIRQPVYPLRLTS